jgi:integrase
LIDFIDGLSKTFGTALVLTGAQPHVVMELMRHSDLKLMMKIYTDVSYLSLAAGVQYLPLFSAPDDMRSNRTCCMGA